MTVHKKQIHLGAHFPGVNNTTVWSDPACRQPDRLRLVRALRAERRARPVRLPVPRRGPAAARAPRADPRPRRRRAGPTRSPCWTRSPPSPTHIGLAGHDQHHVQRAVRAGRQFASLDHLSGGRAAWNMVTTLRRVHRRELPPRRVPRPGSSATSARPRSSRVRRCALWDVATAPRSSTDGPQFDVRGRFPLPPSPQGHPVLIQAGDSAQGRDFAAATADAIFTLHGTLEAGQVFYADVKARLAAVRSQRGRPEDPAGAPRSSWATPTRTRGRRPLAIRRQQVSPQTAIAFLEQVWGRDLSAYDPDGPLPDVEPDVDNVSITRGRVRHAKRPASRRAGVARLRGGARRLSIREVVIEKTGRQSFVGSPRTVAAQMDEFVQGDACDGFILVPHLTPGGLDRFVAEVVPELQDRGSYRTAYPGPTLRDHLGLRHPATSRRRQERRRHDRPARDEPTDSSSEWDAWHADREEQLRDPHGWLSLTALHWLDDTARSFHGLPGTWRAVGEARGLTADGVAALTARPYRDRRWSRSTGSPACSSTDRGAAGRGRSAAPTPTRCGCATRRRSRAPRSRRARVRRATSAGSSRAGSSPTPSRGGSRSARSSTGSSTSRPQSARSASRSAAPSTSSSPSPRQERRPLAALPGRHLRRTHLRRRPLVRGAIPTPRPGDDRLQPHREPALRVHRLRHLPAAAGGEPAHGGGRGGGEGSRVTALRSRR